MKYKRIGNITIFHGDCLEVLPELKSDIITATLTDPPYGISFLGKEWDKGVPGVPFWEAVLSVSKPGALLLAFGGTRTYHRQTCAIEDAGWEVRDCISYVYGSGFPKSMNLSKTADKKAGAKREQYRGKLESDTRAVKLSGNAGIKCLLCGETTVCDKLGDLKCGHPKDSGPVTDLAKKYDGYGTNLKPAHEPIVLAQAPRKTFYSAIKEHGTGGLNIDGCRVPSDGSHKRKYQPTNNGRLVYGEQTGFQPENKDGRWPSNFIVDDSEEVQSLLPEKAKAFFYTIKANKREREAGCEHLPPLTRSDLTKRKEGSVGLDSPRAAVRSKGDIRNTHPTVKPLSIMRYLLELVRQPEGNVILDPFAGSGTTGMACALAGIECILIEKEERHFDICCARVKWALEKRKELGCEPLLDWRVK